MTTLDRRVLRTYRLLGQALLELIKEKGYVDVSIKDITDRADVAYVTFFRHFKDKDELLLHTLGELIDEVVAQIDQQTYDPAMLKACTEKEGMIIFRHVQQHADLYRMLLDESGSLKIYLSIKDRIAGAILHDADFLQEIDLPVPLPILINQSAASLLALIQWWLEQDMPYSPQEMSSIYSQVILMPVMTLLQDYIGEDIFARHRLKPQPDRERQNL